MLEASEAKTHADTVFVTRDLDLSPSDPKINGFPGLIVEHLYVTFGDPSQSQWLLRYCADKQTKSNENPTPATDVGVGNYSYD